MVTIRHNIDPNKFKFFWTKYVLEGDIRHHCAACVKGSWSKKFCAAWNKDNTGSQLPFPNEITFDEKDKEDFKAIYICGVFKKGFSTKKNYPHNLHLPIIPKEGVSDTFDFDGWHIEIDNGYVGRIPPEKELPQQFFEKPYDAHYYTCRIFRWMIGYFYPELLKNK